MKNEAVYDLLDADYQILHDYFGRGENNVMDTLKQFQVQVLSKPPVKSERVIYLRH